MWKNTDIIQLEYLDSDSLWAAISKKIDDIKDGPVYVALREKGRKSIEKWYQDQPWQEVIKDLVENFYRRSNHCNIIELVFTYDYQNLSSLPEQDVTGVLGVRFRTDNPERKVISYSPTSMIAGNFSFETAQRKFQKDSGWEKGENIFVDSFKCHQFIIHVDSSVRIAKIYRGCQIVPQEKVTYENVKAYAFELADWMQRSVSQNEGEVGKMLYKYSPSTYITSRDYNLIRVLSAPYILFRSAKILGDEFFSEVGKTALKYQIDKYYNQTKTFGYISSGRSANIAEAAFVGMNILESDDTEYDEIEESLLKFILNQWREDGSFETSYFPEKKDNFTFYPGETLLYISQRLKKYPDDELLQKAIKSVKFYRDWFRSEEEKNPFFVSWQTQAICNLFELSKDEEILEFAIELNDWLLSYQVLEDKEYPDLSGRFINSSSNISISHVPATGVFLSGISQLHNLVRLNGGLETAYKYKLHILSGIRSVMQNAVSDEVDFFYMLRIRRSLGSVKMREYDNNVRADSIKHVLECLLNILENDKYYF